MAKILPFVNKQEPVVLPKDQPEPLFSGVLDRSMLFPEVSSTEQEEDESEHGHESEE